MGRLKEKVTALKIKKILGNKFDNYCMNPSSTNESFSMSLDFYHRSHKILPHIVLSCMLVLSIHRTKPCSLSLPRLSSKVERTESQIFLLSR